MEGIGDTLRVAERAPITTLLSRAWIACTIEVDNAFESLADGYVGGPAPGATSADSSGGAGSRSVTWTEAAGRLWEPPGREGRHGRAPDSERYVRPSTVASGGERRRGAVRDRALVPRLSIHCALLSLIVRRYSP